MKNSWSGRVGKWLAPLAVLAVLAVSVVGVMATTAVYASGPPGPNAWVELKHGGYALHREPKYFIQFDRFDYDIGKLYHQVLGFQSVYFLDGVNLGNDGEVLAEYKNGSTWGNLIPSYCLTMIYHAGPDYDGYCSNGLRAGSWDTEAQSPDSITLRQKLQYNSTMPPTFGWVTVDTSPEITVSIPTEDSITNDHDYCTGSPTGASLEVYYTAKGDASAPHSNRVWLERQVEDGSWVLTTSTTGSTAPGIKAIARDVIHPLSAPSGTYNYRLRLLDQDLADIVTPVTFSVTCP